jgi:hypothetical protein
MREIEASFEIAKSQPVHATKKELYPVEFMPLLPDFDRYGSIYTFHKSCYYLVCSINHPFFCCMEIQSFDTVSANCFTAFIYLFILIKLLFIVLLGRYDDQFVIAAFDNAPTVDSEVYNKLDKSVRDISESRVSYVAVMHVVFISNSILFACFMKFKIQEILGKDMKVIQ